MNLRFLLAIFLLGHCTVLKGEERTPHDLAHALFLYHIGLTTDSTVDEVQVFLDQTFPKGMTRSDAFVSIGTITDQNSSPFILKDQGSDLYFGMVFRVKEKVLSFLIFIAFEEGKITEVGLSIVPDPSFDGTICVTDEMIEEIANPVQETPAKAAAPDL